jgi:hypothetical protein
LSVSAALAAGVLSGALGGCQILYPTDNFEKPAGSDSGAAGSGAADSGADHSLPDACSAALSDSAQADFALGKFQDTTWSGDHVALAPGKSSGDYVSRVFDLCKPTQLSALEWTPGAPYDKPLPDGAAAETGYSGGNVDMKNNVLLLHLDDDFVDSSPAAINVKFDAPSGEGAVFDPAVFGVGYEDSITSRAYTTVPPGGPLEPGTTDFTWALWVKTTQDCTQNVVYLGTQDAAPDVRPHFWLGCAAAFSECPNQDGTGRVAGYVASTKGDGAGFCGTKPIDDGRWHHVAMVKQGQAPATLKAYVDGVLDAKGTTNFAAPFTFDQPSELSLGAFADNTETQYQASGEFDDVAIWRRALSDAEIAALAARGRLRLSFQVRGCATPSCAAQPAFVGPGAHAAQSFDDSGLAPPVHVALDALPSTRYVQYRAHFESDDPGASPELRGVSFVAPP